MDRIEFGRRIGVLSKLVSDPELRERLQYTGKILLSSATNADDYIKRFIGELIIRDNCQVLDVDGQGTITVLININNIKHPIIQRVHHTQLRLIGHEILLGKSSHTALTMLIKLLIFDKLEVVPQ
jgi:hypothetical protein